MAWVGTAQNWYQSLEPRGFIVIDLVAENEASLPPTQADLAQVAADHGATYPVLADPGWVQAALIDAADGLPNRALLAPGLEFVVVDAPISPADIEPYLPY